MPYYKLDFNPEAMAFVPQDDGIIGTYNVNAPNSLRHFKFNDQLEDLWVPEGMKFRYHAKFTDILLFTSIGHPYLILSEALLRVISTLQIPKHQVFPLKVIKREKVVQYNIFISKATFAEYLDFAHSDFFTGNRKANSQEVIKIKDASEFWRIYEQMDEFNYLSATKIELNTNVIEYDIFRLLEVWLVRTIMYRKPLWRQSQKQGLQASAFFHLMEYDKETRKGHW